MKDIRDEHYNETGGGRAVGSSRPPANDLDGGVRVFDGIGAIPVDDPVECPHCGTRGWPSAIRANEYTAVCGSRWEYAGDAPLGWELTGSGAACYVIEHKNDLLAERDLRIRELEAALSERHLTSIPGGAA